jgi:hypothetical protein
VRLVIESAAAPSKNPHLHRKLTGIRLFHSVTLGADKREMAFFEVDFKLPSALPM